MACQANGWTIRMAGRRATERVEAGRTIIHSLGSGLRIPELLIDLRTSVVPA